MSQEGLPGFAQSFDALDPLGRRYTPDGLARAILIRLAEELDAPPDVIIEGHVGGGAFPRQARLVFPTAKVVGVDLDRSAPGFDLCDVRLVGPWEDVATSILLEHATSRTLVVGNPPFDDPKGGDPDRAQRQFRATYVAAQAIRDLHETWSVDLSWILPHAYLGTQAWTGILAVDPLAVLTPIAGRPWGEFVREVSTYRWRLPTFLRKKRLDAVASGDDVLRRRVLRDGTCSGLRPAISVEEWR